LDKGAILRPVTHIIGAAVTEIDRVRATVPLADAFRLIIGL
jgi:hypothetical protein